VSRAAWQILVIVSLCCRPPGFTVASPGKCLAGAANLTDAQYKWQKMAEDGKKDIVKNRNIIYNLQMNR
jgi:hypothetical protein